MGRFTVEMLANNTFGVLNRVTGLYAKRGFNIESLHGTPTEDPRYSKVVVVSSGDDYTRAQVVAQLEKLYDVVEIRLVTEKQEA